MFGLSFLNAGSLFLLAAVAIPLLVHLLARRRPRRIVFSSLRFIRQVQQQQRRRINLRQLLLLILRTLVILLTILAIFRPVIKLPGLRRSDRHPRTAVAIVIDNSYSMDWLVDTRPALELAFERAGELSAILDENDITLLLTRDRAWNRLHGHLRQGPLPANALDDIAITPAAMPLDSLLAEAQRLLAASDLPNREIYLFSDAQTEPLPADLDTPWFVVPAGHSAQRGNLSCQNARLEQTLTQRRLEQGIAFDVVNHSAAPQRDVLCRLVLDDRTVAETVVDLEPHQRLRTRLGAWIERSGWHQGYVEVKNERLLFDNQAWFAFRYDLAPRVGVITGEPRLPLPLEAGLEVFVDEGDVTLLSGAEPLDQLRGFDALIVYNAHFDTRLQFALESMMDDGEGILFLAHRALDERWREWLRERFDIDLATPPTGATHSVSAIGANHPVMRPFDGAGLEGVAVSGVWRGQPGDAVALLAAGNNPLVLAAEESFVWTFDVGALDSPLLLDSAFPVLLFRTLQSLGGAEMAGSRTVGNRIYTAGKPVRHPSGHIVNVPSASVVAGEPGVWTPGAADDARRVAVNLDYAESDYAPLSDDHPHLLPADGWLDLALPGRYGFETWKLLLAAALLLLAAEMLLVKHGERRTGEAA
ncbi:MAG: BatA and WFA domain-containing protein [Candidatus Cloacimonetes bacterium]|nr:BatA and WFA domain-containing protein [Candidatus Cloacimonadota bacterium]